MRPLVDLLKETDQVSLWELIVGKFKIGKKTILNPFRLDRKTGSCAITIIDGILVFNDFASGDACNLIGAFKKMGKTHDEIVDLFTKKTTVNKLIKMESVHTTFEIKPIAWDEEILNYWVGKVSIELLKKYCTPFKVFTIQQGSYISTKWVNKPGYLFQGINQKLYFPTNTEGFKFLSTACKTVSLYEENGSDTLVITKGWKDFLELKERLPNYDWVVPNSEKLTYSVLSQTVDVTKYKKVKVLFDNDETGMLFGNLLCEEINKIIPCKFYVVPMVKDFDELLETNYVESFINLFKQ